MLHSRKNNNKIKHLHERCLRLTYSMHAYSDKRSSYENLLEKGNSVSIHHKNISQVNSVFHGTESISYLGPKIWDIVPEEFKNKKSLNSFKESIKMWVPTNCPCRLCKVYLDGVRFIINRIKYYYK